MKRKVLTSIKEFSALSAFWFIALLLFWAENMTRAHVLIWFQAAVILVMLSLICDLASKIK